MGMFDYIRCEATLPDGTVDNRGFQTKSFECVMATHVITADGRLFLDFGRRESVPREERTYPDAPDDSIMSLAGSLRWVPNLVEQTTFTGSVEMDQWVAIFLDGRLLAIREEKPWLLEKKEPETGYPVSPPPLRALVERTSTGGVIFNVPAELVGCAVVLVPVENGA